MPTGTVDFPATRHGRSSSGASVATYLCTWKVGVVAAGLRRGASADEVHVARTPRRQDMTWKRQLPRVQTGAQRSLRPGSQTMETSVFSRSTFVGRDDVEGLQPRWPWDARARRDTRRPGTGQAQRAVHHPSACAVVHFVAFLTGLSELCGLVDCCSLGARRGLY